MGSRRCLGDFYRCGSVYLLCMFHTPSFVIYHKHEATEPQRVYIFSFFFCVLYCYWLRFVLPVGLETVLISALYVRAFPWIVLCASPSCFHTDIAFLLSYNFICSGCCRCIEIGFRFNSRSNIIYHHHVEDVWDHKLWLHKSGSQLNEDVWPIPSRALVNDPTETGAYLLFSGLAPPTRQAAPLSLPNHCKTKVTVTWADLIGKGLCTRKGRWVAPPNEGVCPTQSPLLYKDIDDTQVQCIGLCVHSLFLN